MSQPLHVTLFVSQTEGMTDLTDSLDVKKVSGHDCVTRKFLSVLFVDYVQI